MTRGWEQNPTSVRAITLVDYYRMSPAVDEPEKTRSICDQSRPLVESDDELMVLMDVCYAASSDMPSDFASRLPWATQDELARFEPFHERVLEQDAAQRAEEAEQLRRHEEAMNATVDVEIRNNCGSRVVLYFGPEPGNSFGHFDGFDGRTTRSKRVKLVHPIWLVDSGRRAVDRVDIAASTKSVAVASSCTAVTVH